MRARWYDIILWAQSAVSVRPFEMTEILPSPVACAIAHSSSSTAHRAISALGLALIPTAIWSLTHAYHGLGGDAGLYAVQALARLDPSLGTDVFLSHASQDRFTIFSPLYAFFIARLGLRTAGLVLLIVFKTCFFAAAWALCRKLFDSRIALVAVTLLIVSRGDYGAYQVFHYAEDMLTARSLAEALAMTALCLHFYGYRVVALLAGAVAVSVHPLIALPMVLLLLCLGLPLRAGVWWALAAVGAALCVSVGAILAPALGLKWFIVMDAPWLDMVRERSQFCFLQLWSVSDWELNARPFLSLALSFLALADARSRKLSAAAALVGGTGLIIGLIAGVIGPVALLLQGQAWRWAWVTSLVGVLSLVPTVLQLWRSGRCGVLAAMLAAAAWLLPANAGTWLLALALAIWSCRNRIPTRWDPHLPKISAALGIALIGCIAAAGWHGFALPAGTVRESPVLSITRSLLAENGSPIVVSALLGCWISAGRSIWGAALIALGLGTATAFAAPVALNISGLKRSEAQFEEYADWRRVIPPGSSVLVMESYYSAAFAWFTLERPSYLTVDQSSGVIFSRATAMEVLHRSQVLRPIEEPDWRLLSRRSGSHHGRYDARALPLTRERLAALCAYPDLDFIVAREDVGFAPIRHIRAEDGGMSYLYDCKQSAGIE